MAKVQGIGLQGQGQGFGLQRYTQADRRMDDLRYSNTALALRASRGKNVRLSRDAGTLYYICVTTVTWLNVGAHVIIFHCQLSVYLLDALCASVCL